MVTNRSYRLVGHYKNCMKWRAIMEFGTKSKHDQPCILRVTLAAMLTIN